MLFNLLSKSLKLSHKCNGNVNQICRRFSFKKWRNNPLIDELPAKTALHVIGNGSDANPSAVCLSCEDNLYLFNCGEGLQRLYSQYRLKIRKTNHLFLTSNQWHNISGISGFLLTRLDSGAKHMNINAIDCQKLIDFISVFDLKLSDFGFIVNDLKISDYNKPFSDKFVEIMPFVINSGHRNTTTVLYFCKIYPKLGELLLDKCFQLKIPRNLLPVLQSRQSIVLENGQKISPEEVLTADEPEQCFVVLECSSLEILDLILKNSVLLEQIYNNIQNIESVVHMTPESVINSVNYQTFIHHFSLQTKHLVLNQKNPTFGLHSLHRTQRQLHSLDQKLFPMLNEKIEINKEIHTLNGNKNLIKCQTGLQYVLRPLANKGLAFDEFIPLDLKFLRDDALKDHNGNDRQGLDEAITQLKLKQQLLDLNSNQCTDSYPEVLFLGTSSAQPLANRNVTSILVNISGDTSVLLDCGEDTSGQLYRYYGSDKLRDVYMKLKAIFVSHMHSDHHMGLIRLIHQHFYYTNQFLILIIPPILIQWLEDYNKDFETISNKYKAFSTTNLQINDYLNDLRLKQLVAIPVIHCIDSFGVLIETKDNKKIVFSGDCEPTDELINIGMNCDLLIHESTQEDLLEPLARDQKHSTVSEAIDVGRRMNAEFTVLTHFSARYGKMPLIPGIEYNNEKLGIAYDFLRFNLSEVNRLPVLLPALKCLYSTHLDKLKAKEILKKRRFSHNS